MPTPQKRKAADPMEAEVITKIQALAGGYCLTCASYYYGIQFCGYGNIRQPAEERHLCILTDEDRARLRKEYELDSAGRITGKAR